VEEEKAEKEAVGVEGMLVDVEVKMGPECLIWALRKVLEVTIC